MSWIDLLREPDIPQGMSAADVYRAACSGAVMFLYESADTDALSDAVLHAAAGESRARALAALRSLCGHPDPEIRERALTAVYTLAIREAVPKAMDFLIKDDLPAPSKQWQSAKLLFQDKKNRLLKVDPGPEQLTELFLEGDERLRARLLTRAEKLLPNWAMLMRFYDAPTEENRAALTDAFAKFSPEERALLRYAVSLGTDTASLPADIFLHYEDDTALELSLKNNLRPSDVKEEALFYFLSGQWERYYNIDTDYRLVRIAYERQDPELQRRLIAVSRESGNTGWLRRIGSIGIEQAPDSGSLSDRFLLIHGLIEQQHWQRLWELLPKLPLLCVPSVCEALEAAGFIPDNEEDKTFLRDLRKKSAALKGLNVIPLDARLREGAGSVLSLTCGGGKLAAVLSDHQMLIWDLEHRETEPFRITAGDLNFRSALPDKDGQYIAADCSDNNIRIYALRTGQNVKTIPCGQPIRGMFLQPDSRRLILIDRSGGGRVFSYPGGTELFSFASGLSDCLNAAYDPNANRVCIVNAAGDCAVCDVMQKQLITTLRLPELPLAAAPINSRGRLAYIGKGETLNCLNLISGKHVHERISVNSAAGIRRLTEAMNGELYILGGLDGSVTVFDPTAGSAAAVIPGGKSAVTGLCIDEKRRLLFTGTANGTVRGFDLTMLRWMTTSFTLTDLPGLNRVEDYTAKYPEPGVKAAAELLKTVILRRRRFDIEVDFEETDF